MSLFERYKTVTAAVWPFFLVALGSGGFEAARMLADDREGMGIGETTMSRDYSCNQLAAIV